MRKKFEDSCSPRQSIKRMGVYFLAQCDPQWGREFMLEFLERFETFV